MTASSAPIRVLVSDSLSAEGVDILRAGGFEVVHKPDISPADLEAEIGGYDGLVIRSRTTVTEAILKAGAPRLKVVGRAGVGLDNVDVPAASRLGVIVMNTPDGNTLSTAEHTFAMIMAVARSIPQADATMTAGRWDKKKFTGVELHGKTLGVCGMGRIGTEVAKRALAFGMNVMAYDPYLNHENTKRLGIEPATIDGICAAADFITVHTPLNDQTRGMIGPAQFALMKPSVRIVNCARGGIVDEAALIAALQAGKVAGAALDVFEEEPVAADNPLRAMPNTVLTPHLGAATSEAQEGVAKDVAGQIVDALQGRVIRNAVNAPSVDPKILDQLKPYIDLSRRMGGFLAQFHPCPATRLTVYYSGTVLDYPVASVTTAALVGYLSPEHAEGTVNFVNAGPIARDRGIEVIEQKSSNLFHNFANLITVEVTAEDGTVNFVGGTLINPDTPRIVVVNDKFFDVVPDGNLVVIENKDVPGIIGGVGTLMGRHGINIAQMTWGRTAPGHDAITVINVDQDVPKDALDELAALPNIVSAKLIRM